MGFHKSSPSNSISEPNPKTNLGRPIIEIHSNCFPTAPFLVDTRMSMYSQVTLPLAHGGVASSSSFLLPETEPGGLEEALLQLVQDHHQNSLKLRERAEMAKKDAIKRAARAAELMVEAVNSGVQESFINEKRIEHEIRALAATITRFTKQTDQWLTVSHSMNTAIKEIGDFENWMKIMEFDCKSITAAIHNIHQA